MFLMEFDEILSSHLRKEPFVPNDQADSVATLSSLISSVLGSAEEWDDEPSHLSALYHPVGTLESSQGFNTQIDDVQFTQDCNSRGVSFHHQQQQQTLPSFQVAMPSSLISSYKPQFNYGVKTEKPSQWDPAYCSPVTSCESIDDHMSGFCFCSPVEGERLENTVEIKMENPKYAENEIFSPHPFDISDSFNIGLGEVAPDSKVVLGCSRDSPFWGLTVEQRQTHQTTFRYFPKSSEPSLWQGWPLEMPSGEGSNTPPDAVERDDLCEEAFETHSKLSGSKRVEGKTCGVCGDKALGYNFNAVTCESCKAFFRRNALKNKEFRCPFHGRCEVTAVTRRFCQRCRLRKCFDIGMKKEWIMSEEDKKKKRKKIEENRARKIVDIDDLTQQNSSSNDVGYFDDPLTPEGEEKFISKPTKPQAVVVGRVRIEEPINRKIRKTADRSDVHNHDSPLKPVNQDSSKSAHDDFAGKSSTNQHSPSNHYLASDLNAPLDLAPSHNLPHSSQFSVQFPFSSQSFPSSPNFSSEGINTSAIPTLLCENALTPPKEGLVADLLRTQEDCMIDLNLDQKDNFEQVSNSSSENTYHFDPGVIIKVEKSDDEDRPLKSSLYAVAPESHERVRHLSNERANFSYLNCATSSQQEKGFKFNIGETLAIVQPGCKDIPSSYSNSGKGVMDSILNSAINAEYSGLTLLSNTDSLQLNSVERLKINELLEASRGLTAPLCEDSNFKEIPNPSLINVINLTEIAIRRLIKMSKKINAFKNLCQEDQIALLKAGCTEMMILRSVYAYDPDKEVWKIQQDHERFKSIKLKVLKSAKGNIYEEHKRFMLEFEPEWRQDLQIMALLSAIALFTPQRANVIHPDAVEHEQKSYFYLLKRYLESRYGGCIGKTNYYRLLKIIGDLHVLNEDHVRVFLDVNPKEVEPLLIEIFDLKRS